jgi:hypothetical protein
MLPQIVKNITFPIDVLGINMTTVYKQIISEHFCKIRHCETTNTKFNSLEDKDK